MQEPTAQALSDYDAFLARTGPDRLQKILARAELFRMTLDVPGDLVECGVFKGSGIFTWAKLQKIFRPNSERKIVGFDFFGGDRPDASKFQPDQECIEFHSEGWTDPAEIQARLEAMGCGGMVELHAGDVTATVPRFVEENLGFRVSLLYLDLDSYEGTLVALEKLYPLVPPGGVVVLDEYAYRGYGESDAVDEFFAERDVRLRAIPWANTPTAYLVKGDRG